MAESTLAISYAELRSRVGFERGFGTDSEEWSAAQIELIGFVLRDGLRMFYAAFDWSFLKPTTTLVLPSGMSSVPMPDDFHYLCGDIYFVDDSFSYCAPLRVENDGKVLLAQQNTPNNTGVPAVAAIRSGSNPAQLEGQRQELIFWPESNDDYTVQFKYSVLAGVISEAKPYPYGGGAMSQAILLACLAASESSVNGQPGSFMQQYQMELQKAIAMDRRRGPEVVSHKNRYMQMDTSNCTYNGQTS